MDSHRILALAHIDGIDVDGRKRPNRPSRSSPGRRARHGRRTGEDR